MNERSDVARRLLPPMAALHSFAAAARHGHFSRAGAEVGLTQSAVSRQIALLEDWLGVQLFERNGRRVALTADGAAYMEAIGPALQRIRQATAQMIDRTERGAITIATLPSFGMRWLAPRLPGLTAQQADLVVNFAARSDLFEFASTAFDAAIHFGLPDSDRSVSGREAYYLVYPPERLANRRFRAFRDWLLAEAHRQDRPDQNS